MGEEAKGKWGSQGHPPLCLHSRFPEDIERSDALGRLRRVQVVQARYRVDDAKEDSCLHPVVHQV
jgi:hypothetical protein